MKLIYQLLYLIYGYLIFRCLEKVFEEERNKNKEENSGGCYNKVTIERDRDDEILRFDLAFVG